MAAMSTGPSKNGADAPGVLSGNEIDFLIRKVAAAVRRSCPPYLASQAEDIAQEVLVQLLRKLQRTEGNATFSSIYLLKAAHGVTVDAIRRRSRCREQTGLEGEMDAYPRTGPDPEREAIGRSLGRQIRRCLERVLVSRRLAVTLHLLGCSIPEIAQRLSCAVKAAENRVYRGMKDLRECLTREGLQP